MRLTRIDGNNFEQMMQYALGSLAAEEKELNGMNVFPVADGDTGTNMRQTLENAMKSSRSDVKLCGYLKALSGGMLLSARGNSGVILSQLFRGLYLELSRSTTVGTEGLRNAFIRAHRVAYDAVVNPVEGTMLTVAREGIENIKSLITRAMMPDQMLELYIAEMERVLERTPEMLPVLQESGVVDSGGMGYITIVRGMLAYLQGKPMPKAAELTMAAPGAGAPDLSLFTEDSDFEDGYCTEFILQRLKDRRYRQDFSREMFIRRLEGMGNSLVVAESGSRVKVHIHTKHPAQVITLAQVYGEFLTFKLENMQVQHNEFDQQKAEKDKTAAAEPGKALALVAVAEGSGFERIFRDHGCDVVLDGGPTMSVSAQEFLQAYEKLNARHTVVIANSANVVFAAKQAAELYGRDKVTVIPTGSQVEGYFAVGMDVADSPDTEKRIRAMREGAQDVATISVARSAKDFSHNGKAYRKDEWVMFLNGEPETSGENPADMLEKLLENHPELKEKETCAAFRGCLAAEEDAEELEETVGTLMPLADFSVIEGGQEVYSWLIGLV